MPRKRRGQRPGGGRPGQRPRRELQPEASAPEPETPAVEPETPAVEPEVQETPAPAPEATPEEGES